MSQDNYALASFRFFRFCGNDSRFRWMWARVTFDVGSLYGDVGSDSADVGS
ncbi:MAG TPA: hypothetical protein VKR57_06315 [Terriglobales bacterium]|nr:hypothetical protein [Terriglobales bacterium]